MLSALPIKHHTAKDYWFNPFLHQLLITSNCVKGITGVIK